MVRLVRTAPRYVRLVALTLTLCGGLGLVGCGEDETPPAPPAPAPAPEVPSDGIRLMRKDMLTALSGPRLVPAAESDWPRSDETPVVGVGRGASARAYPLCQLAYHGVVLDKIAGDAHLIAYIRLGGRVVSYLAPEDDAVDAFGVAGIASGDLLLYDRRTESTWSMATGTSTEGFRVGASLKPGAPVRIVSWGVWREQHPETRVLQRDPQFADRYFPESWRPDADAPPPGSYGPIPAPPPPERIYVEPDMFPTLDRPDAVSADRATLVGDSDEVLGLELDGEYRAYPAYVMAYYHAVNDRVGERPIFVTFCTVCSSGSAYEPRVAGDPRTLTFGFEGIVDALPVYYDRQTKSRWKHLSATAFDGWFAGAVLKQVGTLRYTTWGAWRAAHPTTTLIEAPMAGLPGDYSVKNASYRGQPFVPEMMSRTQKTKDERLPANELCYGFSDQGQSLAVPYSAVRAAGGVLALRWMDVPVAVVLRPSDDTAVAFDRRLGERTLRLKWTEGDAPQLRDEETGSVFGLDGRAVEGPLKGQRLAIVSGTQVEWYAWAVVWPQTQIHSAD